MIQYLTNLLNILLSILPNISRVSPHIYAFIIVLYVIFNNSIISLYLLVSFYMMFASNYIFKFIFTMLYLFDRIIGIEYYENSNGNNIRKRRVKQLKRHNNINIDSEQVFNTLLNQP